MGYKKKKCQPTFEYHKRKITTTSFAVLNEKKVAMLNLNRNALGDIGNKQTTIQEPIPADNGQLKKEESSNGLLSNENISVLPMQEDVNHDADDAVVETGDDGESVVEDECFDDEVLNREDTIIDIDELETDNTQLVSEYVKEIYKYLGQVEQANRISSTFLENKIVTKEMRAVLIDWLVKVHNTFQLLPETLYLCVQIIDAYLMAHDVPKKQLQLVGITSLFVASKYEELFMLSITDYVNISNNTYTKDEIRLMEISILKQLNYMFCKPLPLHFLRRFSKAGHVNIVIYLFRLARRFGDKI